MAQAQVKKRCNYSSDQMKRAIEAVRTEGMSKKMASKTFNIPRTTLLDKLAGRVSECGAVGRRPVLTSGEENTLVRYAKLMAEIGYPLTKNEFLKEVKFVLDGDGRKTPFKDNLPGYKWFDGFVKRNPEVCMRKPMSLGQERANVTIEKIGNWYKKLEEYLKSDVPDYEHMIKNPRRVFNGDESGFPLSVKPDQVLAGKGAKNVYQVVTNTKAQITVMAACNAVGDFAPPMILFPGERLRDVGLSGFPEAIYATTKNGWMDTDTFVAYLGELVRYAKDQSIEFPIILFVDGHSTHMSLQAAQYCHDNNVILYCLVPNATHIMQPLDIGFFSPMKTVWKKTVKQWQIDHLGIPLNKKEFPCLLKKTWEQVANFENASHGFRKAGLFPLCMDGIDTKKLGPSKIVKNVTDQENEPQENIQIESQTTLDILISDHEEQTNPEVVEQITTNTLPTINQETEKQNTNETVEHAVASATSENETSQSTNTKVTNTLNLQTNKIEEENVSPAFSMLRVPEPKKKTKSTRLAESLPKAISGAVALQMLKEREEKKRAEEIAKEKRKQERIAKKQIKETEKERKRVEREEKKRQKQLQQKSKKATKKTKGKRKRIDSSDSDSECNTSALVSDTNSSDFEEEFEMCPSCNKGDQHPSMWIKCAECRTRWHISCANRPEYQLLDMEERKKLPFICPLCE